MCWLACLSTCLIHHAAMLPALHGGTDRFRFDDNGRGSFICGAGDGLDLIKKVNNCDTTEAAQLAADVLGIDYRAAQTDPAAASQRRSNWKLTASSVSRSASNRQQKSVCRNAPECHTGRI
jgi:phage/plasmid primase-like uncharacterized protein